MHSDSQNKNQLENPLGSFFCIIFFILFLFNITACSANRRVIKNPTLDHWDGSRKIYQNLFPPKYGYLDETEYDRLDFRKPHERGVKEYSRLSDPRGDIDRTRGYDPSAYSVIPDFDMLYNPMNEIQITWIRNATFLIQLGATYQILVDPVMEQPDGFGKDSAIGKLYADSPLAVADLPFAAKSGDSGYDQTIVVAISQDHYDHFSARESPVGPYLK